MDMPSRHHSAKRNVVLVIYLKTLCCALLSRPLLATFLFLSVCLMTLIPLVSWLSSDLHFHQCAASLLHYLGGLGIAKFMGRTNSISKIFCFISIFIQYHLFCMGPYSCIYHLLDHLPLHSVCYLN